ncbi:hypothetical protein NP493_1774g00021 [Ridgeia piscesae]|uniref:Uncharacterized protein n=1 Tax=Ridgeia piscesae TaxID=27915 RepID=A0AAD9JUY9_RIDPI|nr:hypothetical protein NP493_1774g00021 [Ridgeia piscesae]
MYALRDGVVQKTSAFKQTLQSVHAGTYQGRMQALHQVDHVEVFRAVRLRVDWLGVVHVQVDAAFSWRALEERSRRVFLGLGVRRFFGHGDNLDQVRKLACVRACELASEAPSTIRLAARPVLHTVSRSQ